MSTPDMGARYRRTRYGWEPAGCWDAPVAVPEPSRHLKAEQLVAGLVAQTIATGCSLKSAVKWWDYILRN